MTEAEVLKKLDYFKEAIKQLKQEKDYWQQKAEENPEEVIFLEDLKTSYEFLSDNVKTLKDKIDILNQENIKYTIKVTDPSGQWVGPGTVRGNFGSFGMNSNYEKQYSVFVKKKDAEHAQYLVHRALHT